MPLRVLPVILFFVILVTAMVCINGFQIGDVRVVTEHLVSMSAIGDADPVGSGSPADEENLLRGDDFNKQFVLCKIKDRQSALLILRCAQGYCSMRCGISVLLSLNLCDGFQVYIGKEEGLPWHLYQSRARLDDSEWVRGISSFCHGCRFRKGREPDAHLRGMFDHFLAEFSVSLLAHKRIHQIAEKMFDRNRLAQSPSTLKGMIAERIFEFWHSFFQLQLMLKSMYDLKVGGCHDSFVESRNLLSE